MDFTTFFLDIAMASILLESFKLKLMLVSAFIICIWFFSNFFQYQMAPMCFQTEILEFHLKKEVLFCCTGGVLYSPDFLPCSQLSDWSIYFPQPAAKYYKKSTESHFFY